MSLVTGSAKSSILRHTWKIESAERATETVLHRLVNFSSAFIHGSNNQVLKHLEITSGFRINRKRKDLLGAVHFDFYNAPSRRRTDTQRLHLARHILLHFLGLLHHILQVHTTG